MALAIHRSGQHDSTTLDELLEGLCPDELAEGAKVYLDKAYDSEHIRDGFSLLGVTAFVPRRHPRPGRPLNLGKNRWQIERTFSWINRFSRLKIRMEKKASNYMGFLQLASAWITLRLVLG